MLATAFVRCGLPPIWRRADRIPTRHSAWTCDGFYSGAGHDVLVKPSDSKGGHGFDPSRPPLHASFILAGPSVQKRGAVGAIKMTQWRRLSQRFCGWACRRRSRSRLQLQRPRSCTPTVVKGSQRFMLHFSPDSKPNPGEMRKSTTC